MNTSTTVDKDRAKRMASGAMMRRDQESQRPNTKGKSYGSGLKNGPGNARKNILKEYVTGKQQRGQMLSSDRNSSSGFGQVGPTLVRTP